MDRPYDPPYRNLHPDEIRLIHLLPGNRNDAVRAELAHATLSENPEYEALSYVWGKTSDKTLELDGFNLPITDNLHDALRYLRFEDNPRILWIDALCIYQSSTNEKNNQLRLMGSIYANAAVVDVWLGKPSIYSRLGIEALGRAFKGSDSFRSFLSDESHTPGAIIASLGNVFENVWWTRIWTAQEIVLAPRAVLIYGLSSAHWPSDAEVDNVAEIIKDCVTKFRNFSISTIVGQVHRLNQVAYLKKQNRTSSGPSLVELTQMLYYRQSTDPRDKIFALLGLTTGVDATQNSANYDLTPAEVSCRFTVSAINDTNTLDVLSLLGWIAEAPPVPSWAPDLRISHHTAYEGYKLPLDSLPCFGIRPVLSSQLQFPLFDASRSTKPVLGPVKHGLQLVLQGFKLDTVETLIFRERRGKVRPVHDEPEPPWEFHLSADGIQRTMYMAHRLLSEFCANVQSAVVESFKTKKTWNHVFGNLGWAKNHTMPQLSRYPDVKYAVMRTLTGECVDEDVLRRLQKIVDSQDFTTPAGRKQARATVDGFEDRLPAIRFEIPFLAALHRRTFFTMSKGYVGLGPNGMQEGDKVVILMGGKTPFVIRKTGDKGEYQLVGECYVHGIMAGEAMTELDKGRHKLEYFTFV